MGAGYFCVLRCLCCRFYALSDLGQCAVSIKFERNGFQLVLVYSMCYLGRWVGSLCSAQCMGGATEIVAKESALPLQQFVNADDFMNKYGDIIPSADPINQK